ncbi:neurexin-1-like isoform X3 [Saccostrea echinata]|uniref:neurexin-1-like isoform X3 n=1 Tax=Saccostrea echinata TaxID=191078 RepID=UPI002A82DD69|nr:neurexin-1-like isoform X3 [Saccostrea echinata]
MMSPEYSTSCVLHGFLFLVSLSSISSFKLEGSSSSYAKFQKWKPCQNGSLHFEFQTSMASALLLYTDDGGFTDYFELSLLVGALQLKVNLGGSQVRLNLGNNLNDSRWHKVGMFRQGRTVTLTVDQLSTSQEFYGRNLEFGRGRNSPVFIGGLPSLYNDRQSDLTLQHVIYQPFLNGYVRNVLYSNCGESLIRPEMLDSSGIVGETNLCSRHLCKNGGVCITRDTQTTCDCSRTDYEGKFCEIESKKSEVTFFGSEYIFYDFMAQGMDPISSQTDRVEFYFRTKHHTSFLFYTGEKSDYISIALKNGRVMVIVNLGGGEAKLDIGPSGYRFDDNQWHHLLLTRQSRKLTIGNAKYIVQLTVDGIHTTERSMVGVFTMLDSKVLYVGGHPHATRLGQGIIVTNNFKGCMKKVIYTADGLKLDLSKMASTKNSFVQVEGAMTFNQCQDVVETKPITFTTSESFIPLPRWEVSREGATLSFTFQTSEDKGVVIYNSRRGNSDFFAFEIFDGYLWFIIDLGSGAFKDRITTKVNDKMQHHVSLKHYASGKSGSFTLDNETKDYVVPGNSTNLNLDGELYVGGFGTSNDDIPKDLWAGTLGYGYVGCMQDLVVNGNKVDLLMVARKNSRSGIGDECKVEPWAKCLTRPCLNGGVCSEGWNRYMCDCRGTSHRGTQCQSVAASLSFDGGQYMKVVFPEESETEVEDVSLRFQTERESGLLLVTSSQKSADSLMLYLDRGKLKLEININGKREQMTIGREKLNDGDWHTVYFTRRGDTVTLKVDNNDPSADTYPRVQQSMNLLQMEAGRSLMPLDDLYLRQIPGFVGSMQQLYFNNKEIIQLAKANSLPNVNITAKFDSDKPVLKDTVTFKSKDSYVALPKLQARNQFSISFQFKTVESDGLLMYNGGQGQDFIAVELQDGYLHLLFNMGGGSQRVVVNTQQRLNDNQWHLVSIQRPGLEQMQIRVDDEHPTISDLSGSTSVHLDLTGNLYVGGVSKSMYNNMPYSSRHGFQGCMASVDFNGQGPNLVRQALKIYAVEEGCQGPSNSCRSDSCQNGGYCIEQWNSFQCDCDMTSYTGQTCSQESKTVKFGPGPGLITYYFPPNSLPSRSSDRLAFGFRTTPDLDKQVTLLRVESETGTDFLEVEIVDGAVLVSYNMGSQMTIPIGDHFIKVNDGDYHVVRVTRDGAAATLKIDDFDVIRKNPSKNEQQWSVFNNQSKILVGGNGNARQQNAFTGSISGLVFNGLRVIDLACELDPFVVTRGSVQLCPISTRKHEMQSTEGIRIDRKNNEQKIDKNGAKSGNAKGKPASAKDNTLLPPSHQTNRDFPQQKQRDVTKKQIYLKESVVKFPLMNSVELKLSGDVKKEPKDVLMDYMSDDADFDNIADYQGSGHGNQGRTSQEDFPFLYAQSGHQINLFPKSDNGNSFLPQKNNQKWKDGNSGYEKMKSQFGDSIHHVIPRKLPEASSRSNHLRPLSNHKIVRDEGERVVVGKGESHVTYIPITEIHSTPLEGVTDDIIIPAGSGDGGIKCPVDDEDDCASDDASDNIISTTVTFTYKPTTKPPLKSTDVGPCSPKDSLNCDNQVESTNLINTDKKNSSVPMKGNGKTSTEYPLIPANRNREQEVTQTPNLALIIGIVGGVLVALIILIIALYKFRSRDEGSYKVDESQNFAFLEKKQQQGNGHGALLGNHSSGGGKSGKKKDVKEWYV